MPAERIPRAELPVQEPCEFTVTSMVVQGSFFGEEKHWREHQCWQLRYKPSRWFSWEELQTHGVAEDGTPSDSENLLKPIANEKRKKKIGVYEVIRGWRDADNANLFLYVGSAVPGSLRARVVNLVRLKTHIAVGPITNHAKKFLVENEPPLSWLYVRWSRCEYPWEPVLLEYYLHLLREPCFFDKNLFPWLKARESDGCAEWKL